MRNLRAAQNAIADSYSNRDDLMLAWATSGALSRGDMAVATGLAESRVNQIIREVAELRQAHRTTAAAAMVARHMPKDRLFRSGILVDVAGRRLLGLS